MSDTCNNSISIFYFPLIQFNLKEKFDKYSIIVKGLTIINNLGVYGRRWPETKALGIKRHLQVDTKASPLLIQLVVAATTDASKLEITA
jgi:hypothetical protein